MPDAGATARSLPYPVLEDGSLSYPAGDYTVDATADADGASVILRHRITEAPFIAALLQKGAARYGCLVSVPLTGYRKLALSKEAEQKVSWPRDVLGEDPLIRPLIVTVEPIHCTLGPDDGVAEAWQGRRLAFPEGARLALKGYLKAVAALNYLLELHRDDTMAAGSFRVDPCTENGFYFKVRAADDLYRFLQNPRGAHRHRGSVLTHVVSRCFEILARDFGRHDGDDDEGGDWSLHRNLTALASEMERRELPLWNDDGFAPDEAAARMYPHQPPQEAADE